MLRVEECAPRGMLRALAYTSLVQTLAINDVAQRDQALRHVVLKATGLAEEGQGENTGIPSSPHWPLTQVLHPDIAPVPSFTGRDAELADIAAALWNGGTAALTGSPAATALSGLGGVGKSALAREYAWRERERYRGVWWLRAEERATLLGDLIDLGARFIPGLAEVPGREAAARATLDFIAQTPSDKPWLLVYDNAANPASLEKLTPRAGAHVLVTSRWQDWHGRARELPLDVFSEAAALEFLMAQARGAGVAEHAKVVIPHPVPLSNPGLAGLPLKVAKSASGFGVGEGTIAATVEQGSPLPKGEGQGEGLRPVYNPQTYQAAAALASDLGRLPLALAIARAHAWSMGWTFAQYREHLAETKLLEREQTKGVDYPRSIAATFTLAIEKAKATAPQAERLLAIAAYLAPDRIPLAIVTADVMPEIEKGEAVAALAEVSLVTRETLDDGSPAISLHRLVQAVMRRRLATKNNSEIAALAVHFMNKAFPILNGPTDINHWSVCEKLHIHAAAALAFGAEAAGRETATGLLHNLATYLYGRADYRGAEELVRRALAIDEKCFGPDHPKVAIRLNNLAQLLQATNRLAEAEPLMRRALAIGEESFGPGHPNVAIRLNNLAQLLQATNRLAEAEPLMRRALAIDEASFGPGHPEVARDLNNLAQLLKATNRLAEAEPLMRRALAIGEKSFGPGHPQVASALNNLALLLKATNRLAEAEPLMRRALAIDEASFGPGHPNVATSLNNLAQLLQATNRLAEAEPLMRRVIAIFEESFGPSHPNVAASLNNLAALLQATNRLAEAEPLMRRALAIDEESFGPGHPEVATDLNNLAALLQATNRLAEAEPLMRRALAIFAESLGAEHPSTRTVRGNLEALRAEFAQGAVESEAPSAPPGSAVPAKEGRPAGGLFARLFGRG